MSADELHDFRFRFTPQAVLAVLIIAFGLLKTAENLGVISGISVSALWPAGLAAMGLIMFTRAGDRSGKVSGGLLMVVGSWLMAGRLFGWHIGLGALWPLALVAIGVMMIVRASRAEGMTNAQSISDVAFWSGVKRRVSSPVFRRADMTAFMGGMEVDFRQASTGGGEAIIDVFVVMGGLEITVPPDWVVTNQVLAVMGGVDDKSSGTQASTNRLLIRGFVMMGGVEIKT